MGLTINLDGRADSGHKMTFITGHFATEDDQKLQQLRTALRYLQVRKGLITEHGAALGHPIIWGADWNFRRGAVYPILDPENAPHSHPRTENEAHIWPLQYEGLGTRKELRNFGMYDTEKEGKNTQDLWRAWALSGFS